MKFIYVTICFLMVWNSFYKRLLPCPSEIRVLVAIYSEHNADVTLSSRPGKKANMRFRLT